MIDLNDISSTKGLHIAHLNVRSMVNKWDNIKANFLDSGIHILTFSETWLHALLPDNQLCLGNHYTLLRNDRKWNDSNDKTLPPKKGGGTCRYINNTLCFSENTYSDLNISTIDLEAQWVAISQKPNKTILIGHLYRPPQGNAKNCIDMIENALSNVDLQKVESILMGDLNLDLFDKNNKFAKELVNTLKRLGLCQLIKEPTRYSHSKDSCLDLVFTNSNIIARSGVGFFFFFFYFEYLPWADFSVLYKVPVFRSTQHLQIIYFQYLNIRWRNDLYVIHIIVILMCGYC